MKRKERNELFFLCVEQKRINKKKKQRQRKRKRQRREKEREKSQPNSS